MIIKKGSGMGLDVFEFIERLDPVSRAFLLSHIRPVAADAGKILFYQGDLCDSILFLTSGRVRLYSQADGTEEITLYTLEHGQQCIVNTASALSASRAIGSAVTVTNIEGFFISADDAKRLAHMSDVYQGYLFSLYTLRMGALVNLVSDLKFKRLDRRILEWLQQQPDASVPITHEALAAELGTTRVVISRVLKELEKSGAVRLERGQITLLPKGEKGERP